MMHGRGQEPLKDSGFRRASRNVLDARIGEHHRANRQNDQGDYETQDEFHFLLPPAGTTCPIAPGTLGWERPFRRKVEFICLKLFKTAMYVAGSRAPEAADDARRSVDTNFGVVPFGL
jgi:hypothetical protein